MQKEPLLSDNLEWAIYSALETKHTISEQFIEEHALCYIISGTLKVADAFENRTFVAGQFLLFRRNSLAKFIKNSEDSCNFKSIAVIFEKDVLFKFSRTYDISYKEPFTDEKAVLKIENNLLLENFFNTLLPYFNSSLPENLTILKRQELLMLLLHIDPKLKNVLFDFNQPDKIDLEAFMQQNFRFNIELKKLAYLTGRSLATLKRDFDRIFHTSPNRWLRQRRLEEAHFLIKEKHKRPSEVYQEVGFESLSHFSYSFKQFYGINPSDI
jgi:AraC-like DNA-binding protein